MKVIIHGSAPKPVRPPRLPAGVPMTDSTMSPVYEAGDTLLLDAAGPRKTGRDYVFCTDNSGDVVEALRRPVGGVHADTLVLPAVEPATDYPAGPGRMAVRDPDCRGLQERHSPQQLPIWRQLRRLAAYFDGGRASDGQPRSNRPHEQKNRPGGGAGC